MLFGRSKGSEGLMVYLWIVWFHVVSVFGFLFAHGTSVFVMLTLRKERDLERIRALLNLSRSTYAFSYTFILLVLVTGILAGFLGSWWGRLWIWTAIGVGFALTVVMYYFGTRFMNGIRKAVGITYYEGSKKRPPVPAVSSEELDRILRSAPAIPLRPWQLSGCW